MEFISEWLDSDDAVPYPFIEIGIYELEQMLERQARFQQFVSEQSDEVSEAP